MFDICWVILRCNSIVFLLKTTRRAWLRIGVEGKSHLRINLNRLTLCILPAYLIAGYLFVWSLPKEMQPSALTVCARERIAYYALKHGSLGSKLAHFVYPRIERDSRAGCSIASDYASSLFYGRDLEAIEILEKALKVRRKAYGDTDGRTIWALLSIAIPYREAVDHQKAIDCAKEVMKDFEDQPLCEEVVTAYRILISNYSAMRKHKMACLTGEKLVALEEAASEAPQSIMSDYEMLSYHYRDARQFDKQAKMERKIKQIKSQPRFHHPYQKKIKIGCVCSKDDSNLFDLVQ